SDPTNCGSCGNVCVSTICNAGVCAIRCNTAAARVLIYGPGGTLSQPHFPAGTVVTVASEATWRSMTTADFGQYDIIWIDGANCASGSAHLTAARDTQAVWGAATTGRVVLTSMDADFHAAGTAEARQYIANSVNWLKQMGRTANSGKTSLYLAFGCTLVTSPTIYPSNFPTALGTPFGAIDATNCPAGMSRTAAGLTHSVMSGVSSFNWSCIPHGQFVTWPSSFSNLAGTPSATRSACLARNDVCVP
ncbi:MAG: hypothetical protein HY901_05840, partial [Deltaproteobacteria bacterium]|nr:hypothetical protein [Deltaproteobacteria bacterium]